MRRILPLIGLILLAALLWWAEGGLDSDSTTTQPTPQITATAATPTADALPARLPQEVAETLELIDDGGPFPYDRDGIVFENRERRLPSQPRGYWHEYTVPTPGSSDRGARRLVVGQAGEVYYTADHYRSFRLIRSGEGGSS